MDPKEKMRVELKAARDIAAKAEAENRDLTHEEVAAASTHLKSYEAAKADFEKGQSSAEVKAALAAIGIDLGLEQTPERKNAPGDFIAPTRGKSIGQLFTESVEYDAMMKSFPDGRISSKARVQSQPLGLKALLTGTSSTSGGAFVTNDRQSDFELLGRRPLALRDLISVRQTTSDTVEYVRQTAQLNSADVVAEATSSAAPTAPGAAGPLVLAAGGGYKPEGSMAFEQVTETVKTIAEWVPATKRGLADAGQLRGLIDQELRDDLAETEEDEIVNGSGTGEHLRGILSTSGIQAQGYSSTVAGLDPLLETTLLAQTKVKTVGRSRPTGYLMNPTDWEKIQLARLAKNPQNEATAGAIPTLHGLPVVESEAVASGVALVGDFRKAVLWDREQASITATDSHADFFIRNLVAILGEERVAFGVLRPKAFVTIDLTA
ncbi:phage major capsid protein [Rathayibacter sp. VKM Ac-2804]|uniref:phage major capsid protein n=1 Tax=Rathayibacter sp. VKM Ac-2804 TaxID=2609257 RepID=UPI001ABE74A4|nr:phage major capsid protein [Rathayibacter sp. VKM Ac-2804]